MNKQKEFETEVNSYIDKLMNNLWNETVRGSTKTIFLNTKNSNMFSEYMDNYLQGISQKKQIFRKRIDNRSFSKPYYPFLSFIKDNLQYKNRNEIKEFVEKSDVYYFQQPIFLSYFCGEDIQRNEGIVLGELDYEKDRMYQSILNLYFSSAHNTPMIIVVEDLHYAKQSTLELIKHIIKTKEKKNIFFIFSFNKEYNFEIQEKQQYWEEFIEYIQTHDSIVDVEFEAFKDIKQDYFIENKEEQFLELEKIIDLSMESFWFLALEEVNEYVTTVYNKKIITNTYLNSPYYFRMLYLLGETYYYLGEIDTALMHYNSLLNFSKKSNNIKEMSYCYKKIGLICWRKGYVKRAERLGKQSLQLSIESKDERLIFDSNFLLFLLWGKDSNKNIKQCKDIYYDIIETAKKLNMKNSLAYYYTHPCLGEFLDSEEHIRFNTVGIAIAKEYNNKYRLANAYQSQGIFYIEKGNYDEALKYHEKSKELKLELGNKAEIISIYNGIGFNYFIKENYEKAYFYYNKALEYLKISRDYNEIAITLFNLAINYFLALQHRLAIEYLEKLLLLTNILKINFISYHTLFEIYSIIGIAYCKIDNKIKAYEYMIKIKKIKTSRFRLEERILNEVFQALLYKMEEEYEKSTFHFQQAIPYMKKQKYIVPRFYYEYGLMKKEQGEIEEAKRLFKIGIQYCEELDYSFYKDIFLKELGKKKVQEQNFQFYNKLSDLQWIIDSAKQELTINKLHEKINEINFLNILQENTIEEKSKEELIKNVMNLIHDSFFVEYSFLYLKEEGQWKCAYANKSIEESNLDIITLLENLEKEQKIIVISNVGTNLKYSKMGSRFYSIVSIPLIDNDEFIGSILCATKKEEVVIDDDDIKILSMAAKQLTVALKKIKKDEELFQKNKELQEANEYDRLRTEFFSNLSHEFRTPLNVILGALQLLSLNMKNSKESKYIGVMKQNCYRLLRLTNNLIDISKIDSGFYKMNLENHNIVNIIEEITLSVAPYIEQKGISLQFDTDVEEKIMGCDTDQMERVILNLLSNSVKFTDSEGEIKVNLYDKGKTILIVIKDTGIGIPKNKFNIIFQRFGQVDKSLTRNNEGSGIGLSLVKSIVEMWGGNISIESEYGKGSTFIIEIPVTTLPEKDYTKKENHSIALNLVERAKIEFSDIYFQ